MEERGALRLAVLLLDPRREAQDLDLGKNNFVIHVYVYIHTYTYDAAFFTVFFLIKSIITHKRIAILSSSI